MKYQKIRNKIIQRQLRMTNETNENDNEMTKERYISPKKIQKIIDILR